LPPPALALSVVDAPAKAAAAESAAAAHHPASAVTAPPPVALLLRPFALIWASGAAAVACAAFSFSLAVLFVKLLARRVPVLEITLARSGLSLLATLAVAAARGRALAGRGTWGAPELRPLLMLRGAIGCVAMVAYYLALVRLPMADAVLLFFANVPATALAAWLFAGERTGPRAALGAGLALVGLALVLHPPWLFGGHASWGPERAAGVAAGLASAALSAGAFLTIRRIGRREPALVVALYFHAATCVISAFPLLVLRAPEPPVWPASLADAALLAGVAAASFFGQLTLTRGFQLLPAGRASAINLSQVLFSSLWGWLAFGDVPTAVGLAGGVLIVAGALLSGGGGGGGGAAAEAGRVGGGGGGGGIEEDAQASVALTSAGGAAAGPPGAERSAGSKVIKQQMQQQHLQQHQQQRPSWSGGGGGGDVSAAAAREAAGGGVGSLLLPRSQQEALAISAAAAATLEEDDAGRRRSGT